MDDYIFCNFDDNGEIIRTAKENGKYVLLTVKEFNGLKKGLKIIHDRALQSIDKGKADEYGYTLKNAERKIYKTEYSNNMFENYAYLITKTTPHSLKIPLEEASFLVEQDLKAYFNLIDLPSFYHSEFFGGKRKMTEEELLQALSQINGEWDKEYLINNSIFGRIVHDYFNDVESRRVFSFGIEKLSSNFSLGVYEVQYWATGMI